MSADPKDAAQRLNCETVGTVTCYDQQHIALLERAEAAESAATTLSLKLGAAEARLREVDAALAKADPLDPSFQRYTELQEKLDAALKRAEELLENNTRLKAAVDRYAEKRDTAQDERDAARAEVAQLRDLFLSQDRTHGVLNSELTLARKDRDKAEADVSRLQQQLEVAQRRLRDDAL